MKLKPIIYSCLFILSLACTEEKIKKQDYHTLVNQEIESISFDEVDIYPNFSSCETNEVATLTKQCFVETLHLHLTPFLENYALKNDSIELLVQVNKNGKLSIEEIKSNKKEGLPLLKTALNNYLQKELPEIYPAQKQGIPVKCSLILPVIITSEI